MAYIPLTINNGVPPYTISVKLDNDSGERFVKYEDNKIYFDPFYISSYEVYRVTLTDSTGCSAEQTVGGVCNGKPQFTLTTTNAECVSGNLQGASITLNDKINVGSRYVLVKGNNENLSGKHCITDGSLIPSSSVIDIPASLLTKGTTTDLSIRIYGSNCDNYTDASFIITSPACSSGCVPNPITFNQSYNGASETVKYTHTNTDCSDQYIYLALDTLSVPDRIILAINNIQVYDSGCYSSNNISKVKRKMVIHPGETLQITIDGLCSGDSSTQWFFGANSTGQPITINNITWEAPWPEIVRL